MLLAACVVEALLGTTLAIAQRCFDETAAAVCAVSGQDGNGYESATEEQVQDNSQQSKQGLAAEKAGQENGKDGVQDSSARHALNCLDPCVDSQVAVRKRGEKVRVDAENDAGATKLDGIEDGLEELQGCTAKGHGDGVKVRV